ncbi:MAG: ABC transporter ATP-binding protein [Alphaproteobacteria bacterium]|nr:ABC transporter ATP-binding protein [Alphaproteobacteria bacterium]
MNGFGRVARFSRRYVLRYWPWYLGGLVFLTLTNWLAVQIPLEMAKGIDAMRVSDPDGVSRAALLVGAMGVAVIAVRTLSRVLYFTPGRLAEFELRNDLFTRLLLLQPAFFTGQKTGDIVSRASSDIQYLRVMVGFGGLQICNVSAALLLTGYRMFGLSPRLTLYCLGPVVVGMFVVQLGISRFHTLMLRNQRQLGAISDHILASLQGVRTIQGFNAGPAFTERLHERNQAFLRTNISMSWIAALIMPALGLAGSSCVYLLLAVGGPMAATGELTVGELVAFVAYVGYLVMPLMSLGWMVSVFQRGAISLERIDELLYAEPDRPEGPDPLPIPAGSPELTFKNLTFRYPEIKDGEEGRVDALDGLDAHIPAGAVVGIYGRTGSGKSTLVRVLSRLYNPPPSTVFVGDTDLTRVNLDDWRRRIAVVPQVPFLFSDTIANNVSMGERDEARLQDAVTNAALRPDLAALPDALETVVGERGIMLSGGQRQRTALARGLYRDFDLLILDDVLSAVDQKTEQQLIDSLETIATSGRGAKGRPTTLIVSHRLSVMARTDRVLVLDEGRLVDQGTHAELLEREGLYREAWLRQQSEATEGVVA